MKKIRRLLRALPLPLALSIILIDGLRHLLLRAGALRFSQTGEDGILAELLLGRQSGVYVDVGANHPYRFSNTFSLYLKGWHGLLIDPNRELIERCKRVRKLDTAVCAAVSDTEGEVTFYRFKEDLVSTIDPAAKESWQGKATLQEESRVRAAPLHTLLAETGFEGSDITLLSIDVEGHDFQVLSAIDFSKIKPAVVVVEAHDLELATASTNQVYQYMERAGYKLAGYATMNAYFVPKA